MKIVLNIVYIANVYVVGDVKLRDHYDTIEKYRGSAHEDCNIKIKLNYKISILFHDLKNYDSRLNMLEVRKFNFKISIIPNVVRSI